MALRMDALVLQCVTSVLFLYITSVSGHSSGYSYTREELLNYRTTTPVDLLPIFVASAADLLQTLIRKVRRRKRADLVSPVTAPQMVLINLRNRELSRSHLNSMSHLVLTLYHNLVTGSKDFPYIPFKGLFHQDQVTTPFVHVRQSQRENTTPSPPTDSPAGMMLPPAGSSSHPRFLTPVLPEKADLAVLKADRRNCVRTLTVDSLPVTRVISTVYRTEDTEMTNRWRITDYSADGRVLTSVLCRFLNMSAKRAKRKAPEEERSIRSPTPARKRLRL